MARKYSRQKRFFLAFILVFGLVLVAPFAGRVLAQYTPGHSTPGVSGTCLYAMNGQTPATGAARPIGDGFIYRTYVVQARPANNAAIDAKGGLMDTTCNLGTSLSLGGHSLPVVQVYLGRGGDCANYTNYTGCQHVGGPMPFPSVTIPPVANWGISQHTHPNATYFQDDGMAVSINSSMLSCIGIASLCGSNIYQGGIADGHYRVPGSSVPINSMTALRGAGFIRHAGRSILGNGSTNVSSVPIRFRLHNSWSGGYAGAVVLTVKYKQVPPAQDPDPDPEPEPEPTPSISCSSVTTNPSSGIRQGNPFTITGGFKISGGGQGTTRAVVRIVNSGLGIDRELFNGQVARQNAEINRSYGPITGTAGQHPGSFEITVDGAEPGRLLCPFTVDIIRPPNISCGGFSISPDSNPEPGTRFTINAGFQTSNGVGSGRIGYTMTLDMSDSLGISRQIGRGDFPWSGSHPVNGGDTFSSGVPAGIHLGELIVNVDEGIPTSISCPIAIATGERPYFKVYGGDVMAGAAFGDAALPHEQCHNSGASSFIIGWHNETGSSNAGAGTQLAAFATSWIQRFATDQYQGTSDFGQLAFAGYASHPPSANIYGGAFERSNLPCAPDYWAAASGIEPGPVEIAGQALSLGEERARYVNGDVYISGDITYASGAYTDINRIPSFRLIVRGNIYVAPSVTELNGLFVAMPHNGSGGTFYTCSKQSSPPNHGPPEQSHLDGDCRNPLTVYGAVAANRIKLNRTGGTVKNAGSGTSETWQAGGEPAEKFIYTPEVWLKSDFRPSQGDDMFRTLPPVL